MEEREEIERICANCEKCVNIAESDVCICKEHGAVSSGSGCKKFKLDLLKIKTLARTLPDTDETIVLDI